MDHFFDEAARILASSMPRRKALKLLSGALVAGVFGTAGVARAAQRGGPPPPPGCKANETSCAPAGKDKCCAPNSKCCPGNGAPFCATQAKTCCGANACPANQVCCGGTTCCKQCTSSGRCAGTPS